ncbi:MAG: hypothetical protein JWO38_6188 [Gemmataceae bacterium]|nr:hypothetical protein [Gemmataceae bacterium]
MRIVGCLILGVAVAGWAVGGPGDPGRLTPPRPDLSGTPYGLGKPAGVYAAATSCSAAACHGGGQVGRVGSEHTTWAADLSAGPAAPHDPHARAYRVLFNDASRRMTELLEPNAAGRVPAHRNALCLACHMVGGEKDETVRAEGVGCAACHGPSANWLTTHYLPEWKGLSHHEKWGRGFVPTKNLVARVLNCAGCHVGGADREVNHDLIAAGHPRLAFEYTRFHYQQDYRKHWEERTPQPDFEVRAWVIGQAVSLRAAVDLLRARAARVAKNDPSTPWPEVSEGSCYSCHQSIARDPFPESRKDTPRGLASPHSRASGAVPWQPWYSSLGGSASEYHGILVPDRSGVAPVDLTPLRKEMEKRNPNPAEVARLAGRAVEELDAWLAFWQTAEDTQTFVRLSPDQSRDLGRVIAGGALTADGKLAEYDWDSVAQRYLGLAAVYHANGGADPVAGWRGPLDQLRKGLAFPRSGADRFDSPRDYRPADTVAPFTRLRTITTSRTGR